MMRQFALSAVFSALLAVPALAADPVEISKAPVPDVAWAQSWLKDGYLSRYTALNHAADELALASKNLCQKLDAAELKNARAAWLSASQAWRAMDGAPAGPMVLARLGRNIDFRPVRVADVEAAIAGGEGNVAARGLPTIEYLLWGDAQPAGVLASLKAPPRCDYLVKISQWVAQETHALDEGWRVYNTELGAENPFFRQNLFSEHVNLMIASLTSLIKRIPTGTGIKPEQYIEWRSGSSKAQILAQYAGFSRAMGGLNQWLSKDGHAELAAAMKADMLAAQKTCQLLPDDLSQSSAKARQDCSKALTQVKHRLQNDIAEQWDLTLGFTEGDGD
ncbi:imelysin family protein [Chitinibacter bivalviorum]|uniref:Imelysin family protein n=1 Tax=Chitinibacter bivalviorum TaxID=2739434 RepID=A0A7H9BLL9_9NEIS|nr:imelysin family protein [Chitinibacter bivalviorum]QLG88931.1 imelysin family protein [Chitinibacter bivalviorum]